MDVQDIIAQVSAALADAPEKLQGLVSDPKGTIEELTGHDLGDIDPSEIVDGIKSHIAEGGLDLGGLDLGNLAEGLGDALENSPLGGNRRQPGRPLRQEVGPAPANARGQGDEARAASSPLRSTMVPSVTS